jgi:hypothetical protein
LSFVGRVGSVNVTRSNVAVSLFVGINHRENSSTVNIRFLASENRVANRVFANARSGTSDGSVLASFSGVASISCADRRVIASSGRVERSEDTSSCRVASVICASVIVVTDNSGLDASVSGGVARVNDTFVVRIADFVSSSALSVSRVADVNLAGNEWALNVVDQAEIARVRNRDASISRSSFRAREVVARIRGVRGTVNREEDTSYFRIAGISGTFLSVIASNSGGDTSELRVARVGSTSVSVIAYNVSGELATSSVLVGVTEGLDAFVLVFADIRAQALLIASTESFATSTTWVSLNIVTSGNSKTVQNSVQFRKVSGEESQSWVGSNVVDFSSNGLSDTNSSQSNTSSLSSGQDRRELSNVNVVLTVS